MKSNVFFFFCIQVGMRENAVKVLQEHSMEMEVETDPWCNQQDVISDF